MANDMKIAALISSFGCKTGLAPIVVEWLGEHNSYVEPFCLSMAVLLAKPPCAFEIVNDLHCDLVNLALTVQHGSWGPWLYRSVRRLLYSEIAFACAKRKINRYSVARTPEMVGESSARRAYYYFIISWMGRKGTEGTNNTPSFSVRYTNTGGNQAQRFQSAVNSIPSWRRRLSSTTVLCRDAFELIGRLHDQGKQAIYCDPPYLDKSTNYVHDFTARDHERLASQLLRFQKSRVVVSYYDHPLLATLYSDSIWLKVDCSRVKRMNQQTSKPRLENGKAPEVLLINRSSIKN